MRPAFSSTRQAAAFALLLLALLLAPALAQKCLPPREQIYSSIWWVWGDFPYMDGQIFRETNYVDMMFMGSSHIWAGIDTPYVQEQLSNRLGRSAVVRTFGWTWPGYDPLYAVARDLMNHRRVHMLIFDDDCGDSNEPHPLAPRLFRFGEDSAVLRGLPVSMQAIYYYAAIAGMPRNLLELVRNNLPANLNAPNYWDARAHARNIASQLGAMTSRVGFKTDSGEEPFIPSVPATGVQPSGVCVYGSVTRTNFDFASDGIPPLQLHFARKVAALAQAHRCKLVVIHLPTYDERRSTVVSMAAFWPQALHADVAVLGIPPATLFKGLTDAQIRKLYSDGVHFNENGQKYFTALITPTLLKIYESENR